MSGAPYNGYSWQQRAKIIPAHKRATGRRDPFPNEPCAMCGDPNRAANEWHSEDYSEPFSFNPPQSYPLCKPCHGRLHKRFNAALGEWALFCLHLDAGGYGREFTQRFSIGSRRALAQQIAEGTAVKLESLRCVQTADTWWRDLTLDAESLNAPWARPRPLRPRPDSTAFLDAMRSIVISDNDLKLLTAHASAPKRSASMRTLASAALGKNDPRSANLLYGRLARRLGTMLEWRPDQRADGSPIWMSLIAEGWDPPGREYEWTIVPSAAQAVARYGGTCSNP